jgi:branched-chain amino acid aminotransferase
MATIAEPAIEFSHLPHPSPTPLEQRAAILANPGFGMAFSDHMVTIEGSEGAAGTMPRSAPMVRSRSIRPPPSSIMPRKCSKG